MIFGSGKNILGIIESEDNLIKDNLEWWAYLVDCLEWEAHLLMTIGSERRIS